MNRLCFGLSFKKSGSFASKLKDPQHSWLRNAGLRAGDYDERDGVFTEGFMPKGMFTLNLAEETAAALWSGSVAVRFINR